MTPAAVEWHLNGEHGISSEAIFDYLHYGRTNTRWFHNHPSDPDDFRRCELLLDAVPELRARLSEMAVVSPVWAALVARWDELRKMLAEDVAETPGWAHRTYGVMRQIIDGAA